MKQCMADECRKCRHWKVSRIKKLYDTASGGQWGGSGRSYGLQRQWSNENSKLACGCETAKRQRGGQNYLKSATSSACFSICIWPINRLRVMDKMRETDLELTTIADLVQPITMQWCNLLPDPLFEWIEGQQLCVNNQSSIEQICATLTEVALMHCTD